MKNLLKHTILFSVAVATLFFSSTISKSEDLKVGVVDVTLVVESMPEAAQGEKYIKEMSQKYQDTLLSMQKNLEEKVTQYKKQQSMMKKEEQTKTEEALQAQNQTLMAYQQAKFGQTGDLAKERENILAPLREKVAKAIKEVAQTEKISLVFDKANGNVLFSEDKLDITFSVIDKIKRGGTTNSAPKTPAGKK